MTSNSPADHNKALSYHSASLKEAVGQIDTAVWQNLLNTIAELFAAPSVLLTQSSDLGIEVVAANDHKENPYQAGGVVPLECNIYCHQVVKSNASLYVKDAGLEPKWADNPELSEEGLRSYLGLPLNWPDGRVFGTLCVMDRVASHYDDLLQKLLTNFKTIIEYQLDLLDKNHKLSALSMMDEMTQLYNRRGLLEAAQHLIAMSARSQKPLLAIYIDVDNLKPINDKYGHESGDRLIKMAAQVIKTVMRAQDIAARVGGDEFVLLAMVDDESARGALAKRLTKASESVQLTLPGNGQNQVQQTSPVSLSVGSCINTVTNIEELEALIEVADKDMYACKQAKKGI